MKKLSCNFLLQIKINVYENLFETISIVDIFNMSIITVQAFLKKQFKIINQIEILNINTYLWDHYSGRGFDIVYESCTLILRMIR